MLQNPYVLVIVTTVLTAVATMLYNKTLESDTSKVNKAFFKTLVFGLALGLPLAFLANRTDKVLNEPYYENDFGNNFE